MISTIGTSLTNDLTSTTNQTNTTNSLTSTNNATTVNITNSTSIVINPNSLVSKINNGLALLQTASGGISSAQSDLQTILDSVIKSGDASYSDADRQELQAQVNAALQDITSTSQTTSYNGRNLLDGTFSGLTVPGASSSSPSTTITLANLGIKALGAFEVKSGTLGTVTVGNSDSVQPQTLTIQSNNNSYNVQVGAGDSSGQIAASINALSASSGVAAVSSNPVAVLSKLSQAGNVSFTLSNGTQNGSVNITANITDPKNLSALADAINQQTNTTGISASINSNGNLALVGSNGQNISISNFTSDAQGTTTVRIAANNDCQTTTLSDATGASNSATVSGQLTLISSYGFKVSSNATTGSALSSQGSTQPIIAGLRTISSIDVTSQQNVTENLEIISAAITKVSDLASRVYSQNTVLLNELSSISGNTNTINITA